MGFSVVLDDFGIGFSSLGYLRTFKFDGLKVDRMFVQNIENDLDGHAILRAISALGRSLNMKIVAEGVETHLQNDLVRAAGCDLIQGHFYHRAKSVAELEALIVDQGGAVAARLARLKKSG
jgi:EAL domain-containing protein (putative c-di-GMP-specific phosphodiesterase class I)